MTSASGGFAPSERQSSSADVGRPALRLPDDGPYQVNLVGSEPRCARRALPTRERRTHVANDAARPLLRHSRRNPLVRLRARVRASFRQMSAPQPLGRRATPRYRHLPALTGGCRYQAGGPCPRRRRRLRRPRPYARGCSSCRIRGAAGRGRAGRLAGAGRAGRGAGRRGASAHHRPPDTCPDRGHDRRPVSMFYRPADRNAGLRSRALRPVGCARWRPHGRNASLTGRTNRCHT